MSFKSKLPLLMILATIAVGHLSASMAFAGVTRYVYDDLDRLKEVRYKDGQVIVYQYDQIGNMTDKGSNPNTVTPAYHVLEVEKIWTCSGTVTSDTSSIACGSICAIQFATDTYISLTATPATNCVFTGWSGGGCSEAVPFCTVHITSDMSVTASFAPTQTNFYIAKIMRNSSEYFDIQDAFNYTQTGDVIKAKSVMVAQDLFLGANKQITLQGGYDDANYTSQAGFTTLRGPLTISNGGKLTVNRLTIQLP